MTSNYVTTGTYAREALLCKQQDSSGVKLLWESAGGCTSANVTPAQAFAMAGADFTVEKRPIAFDRNAGTPADFYPNWCGIRSHQAVVRTDTNQALGVVSRTYTPIQNSELLNLFNFLREDATINNILVLDGGARIFVTASIDMEAEIRSGDKVRRYLHCYTGHDGGTAMRVFFSDMRVWCCNQLSYVFGRASKQAVASEHGVSIRHTSGGTDMARRLPELIDLQGRKFRKEIEQLQPMLTTRLTPEAANHILSTTFSDRLAVPIAVERGSKEKRERTLADLPEVDIIRSHYGMGTGIGIDPSERSVFNLFMAVTQWATHDAGNRKDETERARLRLEALWGGNLAQRIERTRAACLEVCAAA